MYGTSYPHNNYNFPAGVSALPGESLNDVICNNFNKLSTADKLIIAEDAIDFDVFIELEQEAEDDADLWHTIENSKHLLEKVHRWYIGLWLKV